MSASGDRDIKQPPLPTRLRYYLGFRLGPEWRDWVESDLRSKDWVAREASVYVSLLVATGAIVRFVTGDIPVVFIGIVAVYLLLWMFPSWRATIRATRAASHERKWRKQAARHPGRM